MGGKRTDIKMQLNFETLALNLKWGTDDKREWMFRRPQAHIWPSVFLWKMPHIQRCTPTQGLVRHSYEQIQLEESMSCRERMTASALEKSGIIMEDVQDVDPTLEAESI